MTLAKGTPSGGPELAVRRHGSGPPLVLVHGGFVDSRCWSAVLPSLASRRTVVTIDRRGHGESPRYSGPHTLSDDVTDLMDIVAAFDEPVAMFAHSAGCLVALGAVLHGARVNHLALYEAPTYREPSITAETWRRLDEAVIREDRPALVDMLLNDVVGRSNGEVTSCQALVGILSSPFGAMLLDNVLSVPTELQALEGHIWADEDLRALTTPTTAAVGDQSPPFNRRFGDRLVSLSPAARLLVLPGAGHGAPLTDPAVILKSFNDH
ncbi:MAG: alpha/beta fold hydrolase [Dermatophilaceae bacterium]